MVCQTSEIRPNLHIVAIRVFLVSLDKTKWEQLALYAARSSCRTDADKQHAFLGSENPLPIVHDDYLVRRRYDMHSLNRDTRTGQSFWLSLFLSQFTYLSQYLSASSTYGEHEYYTCYHCRR